MNGRPRTSTLIISGLFLAILALYILVRPGASAGRPGAAGCHPELDANRVTHPNAVRANPNAVTVAVALAVRQPVGHAERLGHGARVSRSQRVADQRADRAQPAADRGVLYPGRVTGGQAGGDSHGGLSFARCGG